MQNIRIMTYDETEWFDIPWWWLPRGTQGPTLNDIEASADRSKIKAKLSRVRAGEVPAATLDIDVRLTQKELYPLLKILKHPKIKIFYFEKYLNSFVTATFYNVKPNPPWWQIPEDDNTDNIIYDKFKIEFAGYEDISLCSM